MNQCPSYIDSSPLTARELTYRTLQQILKYAVIVVSTAPMLCLYPFVQKYFRQGVMIGSIKG